MAPPGDDTVDVVVGVACPDSAASSASSWRVVGVTAASWQAPWWTTFSPAGRPRTKEWWPRERWESLAGRGARPSCSRRGANHRARPTKEAKRLRFACCLCLTSRAPHNRSDVQTQQQMRHSIDLLLFWRSSRVGKCNATCAVNQTVLSVIRLG